MVFDLNIYMIATVNKWSKYSQPYGQTSAATGCTIHCMYTDLIGESLLQTVPQRELETLAVIPRVLLADDQAEMLEVINLVLSNEFRIVGTVDDGMTAIESAMNLRPDALVLDISMPEVNGIEVAYCLKRLGSQARVIFLTVHADPEFVEAALSAGAFGYVLKTSLVTDLVPAIWAAMQEKIFVSPSIQLH